MDQRYHKSTQIANTLTPAVGWVLSVPGLVALVDHAARNGNGWHIVSCSIYGASLVVSYAAFTHLSCFQIS